jgi:hypothetical protein
MWLRSPNGVSEWEIVMLQKSFCKELLARAWAELDSISRLIESLSVMPVSSRVAEEIYQSANDIRQVQFLFNGFFYNSFFLPQLTFNHILGN